jgi:hypothetical protein
MQFVHPSVADYRDVHRHKVKFCTATSGFESNPQSSVVSGGAMGRKVTYWVSTVIVAAVMGLAAFAYLSGSSEAVEGFAKLGYPQHFRVILGIAKVLGVIALLAPGLPIVKEWAYAGFTFAWLGALVAHTLAHDPLSSRLSPLVLLALLAVSYATRPASRKMALARPAAV